ncbi:MAG: phosphatidate cytidylyltransferase [Flavobacteriaceae bacterium]|nr:phosphatidate cytidylyltransferase [Flavobacteriaceae bacterium]
MKTLLIRTLSGLVYAMVVIGAILYGATTAGILFLLFMLGGIYEFQKMIKTQSIFPYLSGVLLFLSVYFKSYQTVFIMGSFLMLFLAFLPLLSKNRTHLPTSFLGKLSLTFLYICVPFSLLIRLPYVLDANKYQSSVLIGIIVLTWVSDSFAYLVGSFFGKHKLIEHISAKKTIEGFLGGFIFTIIFGYLLSLLFPVLQWCQWLVVSFIVGVFGVLGDLVESMFKREYNIKDSGAIMPGHGGILDRLDSIIFSTPFIFAYLHII